MKKLSLLIISNLLIANITNDATITIGAGVTLTTNGDFINNGSILNYGTFDIKGDYTNNFKLENFTGSTLALTGDGDQDFTFTHNEGSTEYGAEYCQQIETEEECESGFCDWNYNDEDNDGECNSDGFGENGLIVDNLTIDGSGNKNFILEESERGGEGLEVKVLGTIDAKNGILKSTELELIGDEAYLNETGGVVHGIVWGGKLFEPGTMVNAGGLGLHISHSNENATFIAVARAIGELSDYDWFKAPLFENNGTGFIDRSYTVMFIDEVNTIDSLAFTYRDDELSGLTIEDNLSLFSLIPNDDNWADVNPDIDCEYDDEQACNEVAECGWASGESECMAIMTDLMNLSSNINTESNTIMSANIPTSQLYDYNVSCSNNECDTTISFSMSVLHISAAQVGCALDGELNQYMHGESVNYDSGAFFGEYTCEYHFQKALGGGANLMSFYGAQDDDMSVDNMLSSLDASGIISEGTAATNISGEWMGSLSEINRSSGYWIILNDADILDLIGTPTRHDLEYNLHSSANLISFSGYQPTDISDALPDDMESCISGIIGGGVAATYLDGIGWSGSLDAFEPWKGYWMINSCDDITFQFEGGMVLPRTADNKVEIPGELAFNQSTKQAFYFIEDIEGAKEGDFIVAYHGDNIVGSASYTGAYSTVPVMGDDGTEHSIGYANSGDRIELILVSDSKEYILNTGDLHFENMGMHVMGILSKRALIPETYALHSAYPNPFNPTTNIKFDLPEDINVSLAVYDINGRLVKEMHSGMMDAGYHSIVWNANTTASGMYFIKLHAGTFIKTQKIMLIK